jgi:GTP-binding protein
MIMFIDRVRLKLVGGRGGHGVVAWRREKYIPKGGPTGGNGGKGGSVFIQTDRNTHSLEEYRNKRHLLAEDGACGGAEQRTGRDGKDLTIKVPCGTLVKDAESGEIIADLTELGQTYQICQGGRGGRGNATFATPTNRAPNKRTEGTLGTEISIELELKLIADVGLVGFPNAGKSSLLSRLTKQHPETAAYPFTTLKPHIGMMEFDDFSRIFIADIPGIIDGAHENRGLGLEFLRHIERNEVLIYMLDASGIDNRTPLEDYKVLKQELQEYNPELLKKPSLVALNKCDTEESVELIKEFKENIELEHPLFVTSTLTGEGIEPLVATFRKLAQQNGKRFI